MSNIELIKRCQAGDHGSYYELYQQYSKNALRTAYLISGKSDLAEDILQETFIECFRNINSLKNVEAFDTWFYKILTRKGWKMMKTYRSMLPVEDENLEGLLLNTDHTSQIDASDTEIMINEALEKLSMPLKTVVVLFYYNDMTIKEISKVLGCFEGTVKSRLHHAKKRLYDMMNDHELLDETLKLNTCK